MIKADIINRVADEAKITKVKAVEAVEAVFDAMKNAMPQEPRLGALPSHSCVPR